MPEVEDDRDDDEAGPPARRESAEGTWAVLRFFRMRQRGEWWTMAVVTASGDDERARVCCGERNRRGEREQRVRERREGLGAGAHREAVE